MTSTPSSTDPNRSPKGLFVLPDGRSVAVTFFLVASLFFLWGFCNSMIDGMDKHFQDQLGLTKAQSAWVQFAHYMGYSLMALPAGLLTRRLGYKYGIIFGLMMVAVGAFWFYPATQISQFWAFLLGVCVIAMGLTVLETVANPYTTVLGPKEYGASRINLAQSFNGVGWIVGPLVGASYFYSEGGVQKAHGQLYIPYVGVGVLVLIIAVLVFRAYVPDIKVEDEYHTDDQENVTWKKNNVLVFLMMLLNTAALALSVYLILHTILPAATDMIKEADVDRYWWAFVGLVVVASPFLLTVTKRVTTHSIWAHPHFSGATLAQFFYVAAQAGIFSFFINSMTVDKHNGSSIVPELPASWAGGTLSKWYWIETRTSISPGELGNLPVLADRLFKRSDPVADFVHGQLSREGRLLLAVNATAAGSKPASVAFVQNELLALSNSVVKATPQPDDSKAALQERLQPAEHVLQQLNALSDTRFGQDFERVLRKTLVNDLNEIMRKELTTKFDAKDMNASALVARIMNKSDAVSAYWNETSLPAKVKSVLEQHQNAPTKETEAILAKALTKSLNGLIEDEHLYDAKRFENFELRGEVKHLIQSGAYTNCWGRFNRMLLEDVYGAELSKLPVFYDGSRFATTTLKSDTQRLLESVPSLENARLRLNRMLLADAFPGGVSFNDGVLCLSDKGANKLSSIAFGFFLLGRVVSAWLMRRKPAHKMVGTFALANVILCAVVIAKLGWLSVAGVFLSYFFMSLMFPTIFALGIFGLGSQAKKKAAAFIVMSITGGALMPKLMGRLGDVYDMATSFWMPLGCFILIMLYGYFWPKLSQSDGVRDLGTSGGH